MNATYLESGGESAPAAEAMASSRVENRKKRWTSQELFGGGRELVIVHAESEYRLRLTSQGKLVLTK